MKLSHTIAQNGPTLQIKCPGNVKRESAGVGDSNNAAYITVRHTSINTAVYTADVTPVLTLPSIRRMSHQYSSSLQKDQYLTGPTQNMPAETLIRDQLICNAEQTKQVGSHGAGSYLDETSTT